MTLQDEVVQVSKNKQIRVQYRGNRVEVSAWTKADDDQWRLVDDVIVIDASEWLAAMKQGERALLDWQNHQKRARKLTPHNINGIKRRNESMIEQLAHLKSEIDRLTVTTREQIQQASYDLILRRERNGN